MMRKNRHKRILHILQTNKQVSLGTVQTLPAPPEEMKAAATAPPPERRERTRSPRGQDMHQHMSSLLDSVTTGVISLDGEGRIRVFNASAESLFRLPRAKVVGVSFRDAGRIMTFADTGIRAFWERLSDAVWAAGAALDLEYDFALKNGQRRVISYSVYP